jgi:NADPH:quinone reductase-like Zn-dependent oxidoreductase
MSQTKNSEYSYSWANRKGGFDAEYVAVAAKKVAHIPGRLDLKHADAISVTGLTALQGVDDALHSRRGRRRGKARPPVREAARCAPLHRATPGEDWRWCYMHEAEV